MGILLSFATVLIDAFNNTFIKKGAGGFSLLAVSWAWQVFSLVVLIPALFIVGIPTIQTTFWLPASLKIVMQIAAILLYTAALRKTDISLAVPMLAFTPLVTLVVSFFSNGDTPTTIGIIGVVFIIFGVYLLNIKEARKNIFTPFKVIFNNKGVFYMFLVSLLWGITTSLDRTAVLSSAPIFYSAFVAVAISLMLTPMAVFKYKKEFLNIFKPVNLKKLVPIGILDGIAQITQMTAVGLTLAAYVISIKRSSIIISSLLGFVMFKEDIKKRILPIIIMFLGILLIVLFR